MSQPLSTPAPTAALKNPEDPRVRAGIVLRDPAALALAYEVYWPRLFRQACLVLPPRMDPEDAASEVFLHVVENASKYDPAYSLYAWMARICVNLCLDRRRRFGLTMVRDWLHARRSEAASDQALSSEARAALRAALGHLSPRTREAVALRYLFLLSEGDIAAVLGMERGAVATAISRGLAALRSGRRGKDLREWWELTGEKHEQADD
jgi:RNA polymerase sigma factor (sigma-70 family)